MGAAVVGAAVVGAAVVGAAVVGAAVVGASVVGAAVVGAAVVGAAVVGAAVVGVAVLGAAVVEAVVETVGAVVIGSAAAGVVVAADTGAAVVATTPVLGCTPGWVEALGPALAASVVADAVVAGAVVVGPECPGAFATSVTNVVEALRATAVVVLGVVATPCFVAAARGNDAVGPTAVAVLVGVEPTAGADMDAVVATGGAEVGTVVGWSVPSSAKGSAKASSSGTVVSEGGVSATTTGPSHARVSTAAPASVFGAPVDAGTDGVVALAGAAVAGDRADQLGFGADAIAATLPSSPVELTPTATIFPARAPRGENSPVGARRSRWRLARPRARSAELRPGRTDMRLPSGTAPSCGEPRSKNCSLPASTETPADALDARRSIGIGERKVDPSTTQSGFSRAALVRLPR